MLVQARRGPVTSCNRRKNRSARRHRGAGTHPGGGVDTKADIKVLLKLEHHEAQRGCEKQVVLPPERARAREREREVVSLCSRLIPRRTCLKIVAC